MTLNRYHDVEVHYIREAVTGGRYIGVPFHTFALTLAGLNNLDYPV